MLQLVNRTGFAAALTPAPDTEGADAVFAFLKAGFTLMPKVVPLDPPVPASFEDSWCGPPGVSSLRLPSDFSLPKPGTDVVVIANVHAPGGRPVPAVDVEVSVGPLRKTLRVFGERVWKKGLLSSKPSAAEPFETLPLRWERAFGGVAPAVEGSPGEVDLRNPIGRGFRADLAGRELDGFPLPNIEDPARLITGPKDLPAPACFGAVCGHWEPRRSYAGTYDDAWQKGRAPYLPVDFDPRFLQVAPPDQVVDGYLSGGEAVRLTNLSPEGELPFVLPAWEVRACFVVAGNLEERPVNLDTVLIDVEANLLLMVWRTALSCDKKMLQVERLELDARPRGR